MFSIYTVEIPSLVNQYGVMYKMFADDIKILKNITSAEDPTALQSATNDNVDW